MALITSDAWMECQSMDRRIVRRKAKKAMSPWKCYQHCQDCAAELKKEKLVSSWRKFSEPVAIATTPQTYIFPFQHATFWSHRMSRSHSHSTDYSPPSRRPHHHSTSKHVHLRGAEP